jgi:hypothetical protein
MKPIFTIKDWDALFENCASRKLKMLGWVPMPNNHDSVAYSRLMNRKDGPEIFAAWILLVQLASKCSQRGVLRSSDGRPYDAEEIAVKTRAPQKIFVNALPYLCSAGWMICEPPLAESPDASADSPDVSADNGRLAGANRIEGKGMELNSPLTPRDKLGGDLPANLDFDSFRKVWSEWEVHRREIKKPLKPTQIQKQLKKLSEMGLTKALEALNHTIQNGWQGIRQPDLSPGGVSPKPGNNSPLAIIADLERQTDRLDG